MTLETYDEDELEMMEEMGRRRVVESLLDWDQRHLSEFE